jgi:hypothetical protein
MPTIEVRFERLVAEAEVRVGDSGLPTVLNSITNTIEVRTSLCPLSFASGRACGGKQRLIWFGCVLQLQEAANALRILPNRKRTMPILHDVSGIIEPRR